ncbi:hypothetical protein GOBAR_AA23246 [Gossypium barbadense]|uniref:Uncharacterized protein n=1 Tax=Gossypium barbadense TaxID=3634 RepID=A0A2P5X262_GOSBA|nr:hypothetical protein GOBAR_AA23246 [Gossypium barbadense]
MEGCNTTFFHRFAPQRRRINYIKELKMKNNSVTTYKSEMAVITKEYFSKLFKSSRGEGLESGLEGVNRCVTEDMNRELNEVYKIEEIQKTLKEMAQLKVVGKDDFPTFFFEKFWHKCKNRAELLEHTFRDCLAIKEIFGKLRVQRSQGNKALHEGFHRLALETIQFTKAYLSDWDRAVQTGLDLEYRQKISRKGNEVAHVVAREGLNRKETAHLEGQVPESAVAAVEKDNRRRDLS